MAYLKLDDDLAEARKVATRLIDKFAPTSASPKAWLDVESTPNGPQRVHEQLKRELDPAYYFVRTFGEVDDATPEIDRVEPELLVVNFLGALDIRLEVLQQTRKTDARKRFVDKAERQRLKLEGQEIGTALAQQMNVLSTSVILPEHKHTNILLHSEIFERQLLHCADKGIDPVANRRFLVASQLASQRAFITNPALQESLKAPNNLVTTKGYVNSPIKTVLLGFADLVGDSYVKTCDPNATAEFSRIPNKRFLSTAKAQAHELGRTFAATVIESLGVAKFNEVLPQAPPTPDELRKPALWLSRRPR